MESKRMKITYFSKKEKMGIFIYRDGKYIIKN